MSRPDPSNDELERGIGLFGKVVGEQQADEMRRHIASHAFGSRIAKWAAQFAIGTVWVGEGLDPKARSCAVLGMLIAQRDTESLRYHVRIALENGLGEREIEEVVCQAVPIVGFPAANAARATIAATLEEIAAQPAGTTRRD